MKKDKMGTIWFIIGLLPYIITLTVSIAAIFKGTSTCFLTTGYGLCDHVEGFKAFIEIWHLALEVLYPIFLVCTFFIILGINNYRMTELNKNRLLLIFGSIPFILSISLFLLACISMTTKSIYTIFSEVFINHYFIVFSNFIGLFVVLLGLSGLNKLENEKKEKLKEKKEDVE